MSGGRHPVADIQESTMLFPEILERAESKIKGHRTNAIDALRQHNKLTPSSSNAMPRPVDVWTDDARAAVGLEGVSAAAYRERHGSTVAGGRAPLVGSWRGEAPRLQAMPFVPDDPDEALEALADHCLAARALIGEHGSPVMARLIDLLLFEVGVAIASRIEDEPDAIAKRNGSA